MTKQEYIERVRQALMREDDLSREDYLEAIDELADEVVAMANEAHEETP